METFILYLAYKTDFRKGTAMHFPNLMDRIILAYSQTTEKPSSTKQKNYSDFPN